jgi:cytochrome c peroxidase
VSRSRGVAPAPKLDLFGKLDPAKATPAEMRGQEVFFGKGQCASCHQPPFYTDNLMHDLKTERFFKPELVNYAEEVATGRSRPSRCVGSRAPADTGRYR